MGKDNTKATGIDVLAQISLFGLKEISNLALQVAPNSFQYFQRLLIGHYNHSMSVDHGIKRNAQSFVNMMLSIQWQKGYHSNSAKQFENKIWRHLARF